MQIFWENLKWNHTTKSLLLLLTAPASQEGRLYNCTVTASHAGRLYNCLVTHRPVQTFNFFQTKGFFLLSQNQK